MHSYADASSFQYCVGSGYFASRLLEAKIVLAAILRKCQNSPKPNANPNPNRGKTLFCL